MSNAGIQAQLSLDARDTSIRRLFSQALEYLDRQELWHDSIPYTQSERDQVHELFEEERDSVVRRCMGEMANVASIRLSVAKRRVAITRVARKRLAT